jgi:IclR family mhp operon transcriptional activator
MATYKPVRSLQRGLEVLCALNRHNGASVQSLAAAVGIHRTTVQRLLEMLRVLGYVDRSASDGHYRLALGVRRLSDGFDDDAWVSAVAEPALRELHGRILWPSNVATFDADAMLIRESTHRYSPFSIHHATVGQRLPMLRSALGQAYLAFCPDAQREAVLGILHASRGPDAALARDASFLREVLRRARRNGYVAKPGDREKRIAAMAVPIMRGEQVFACINMVFFRKAMSIPAAVQKHLEPLRDTAAAIASRLRAERLWPVEAAAQPGEPRTPPSDDQRPRSRIPAYVER